MTDIIAYLKLAVGRGASDIFIVAGAPVCVKTGGRIEPADDARLMPDRTGVLIREIYGMAERPVSKLLETGDDDFSFALSGLARFRVSAYRQRGSLAAVIRIVSFSIPDHRSLGIPESVMELAGLTYGMVLVTGTAGSGKSTTQACIIDRINHTRGCHIITLEDPIEFLHRDDRSIISQREIAIDTCDFSSALRSCLRQAPDVIQLGELRDAETIRIAMTAAETGHLLFATLHTKGAVNSVDRIIDSFPADQQEQIRIQLSSVLRTVVSQQLLPGKDGGLVPAFEIMNMSPAVRSMIRSGRTCQINNVIASGASDGMLSMDRSLLALYRQGLISPDAAFDYCDDPDRLRRLI